MTLLAGRVALLTVLMTLLVSVVEHVARPKALPRALAAQRVLPRPLIGPVAGAAVLAEAALAGTGALGLATGPRGLALLRFSLAGAALLLCAYALHSWFLVAGRDGAPCGCAGSDMPVNGWVAVRAAVLAALALLGWALGGPILPAGGSGGRIAVAVAAAAAFAALLWHLPMAMQDPARGTVNRHRQELLQRIREG